MPTYLFVILAVFAPSAFYPLQTGSMIRVLIIVVITSLIMPALSVGTLKISAFISDVQLSNRRDRLLPFFFVTLFYGISTFMFYKKLHLNDLIFTLFACTTVLLIIILIITFFWKISVHSAGVGGAIGILLGVKVSFPSSELLYPVIGIIMISGLVMSSRLRLNAHDPIQVYAGLLLGFAVCFFGIYWLI
jgi:membrane-associated phospholipid phosphatase